MPEMNVELNRIDLVFGHLLSCPLCLFHLFLRVGTRKAKRTDMGRSITQASTSQKTAKQAR